MRFHRDIIEVQLLTRFRRAFDCAPQVFQVEKI